MTDTRGATVIKISRDEPPEAVDRVIGYLEDVRLRDLNWNGATFLVERGEFTCIDNDESPDAITLMYAVQRILVS